MGRKRKPSKTFLKVEDEAKAVDVALGRLDSARAVFEKSRTQVALEVGAVLATAQAKLSRYGEGVFIRWIQERLGLKKTTAYKWLCLHEYFGDCPQCVQSIDVSALYLLTRDNGPAFRHAREDALASASKGKRVTRQAVIRILQTYRDEAVRDGWDDEDVPEVPGDPTTFQQLKRIWLRATRDEQRQFKQWATRRERSRKGRRALRELANGDATTPPKPTKVKPTIKALPKSSRPAASLPRQEDDSTPDLTPIERHGDIWLKREDLFQINGVCGAKVRACWEIAQDATKGLVTGASMKSPQLPIVAAIANRLGLPCHLWTSKGTRYTPEMKEAEKRFGAEICRAPGTFDSSFAAAARKDAEKRGWMLIPFGMKDECVLPLIMRQTENIPETAKRIVIILGSGVSASGVLWGLWKRKQDIPVLGVQIGADPRKTLDMYAPKEWEEMMEIVKSPHKYSKLVEAEVGGVVLDPIYEAKAQKFLRTGDLLWVIGLRNTPARKDRK